MAIGMLLLILALLCFVVAAAGVASRINLTAAGLALVTLSMLVGGVVLS